MNIPTGLVLPSEVHEIDDETGKVSEEAVKIDITVYDIAAHYVFKGHTWAVVDGSVYKIFLTESELIRKIQNAEQDFKIRNGEIL